MLLLCQYVCIVCGDAVFVVFGVFTNRCEVTNLFTVITDTSLQLPDGLAYVGVRAFGAVNLVNYTTFLAVQGFVLRVYQ